MEIDKNKLDDVIKKTEKVFSEYKRKKLLSKESVLFFTKKIYGQEKDIIFLNNIFDIKDKIKNSEKPWAYHYSLHLNWVIFFRILTVEIWDQLSNFERDDFMDIFEKTRALEEIFNNVDGIIEDGDKVYLIETDVSFIKPSLDRWMI